GNTGGLTQNFVNAASTGKYRYDQPMFRLDHVVNPTNRVYGLFTFQHGHEYRNQNGIPGPAAGGNIWSQRRNFNLILDYTRVLSGRTIFDLRASFGGFSSRFPGARPGSRRNAHGVGDD